ncbi:restriction endonuclease subunit S [Thalassolituus oleivorans]|uniref:restriction endonuclease subunit S n=1 Tax=Thalassolituus oleivorans TaxID=187493 RepID=UPI0009492C6F|nr:restriction endonuclease subunit S [Thalassolituus oleivorans]APR68563.1 restriction endonuclease subunit S [Thalassolituus oleivorans]
MEQVLYKLPDGWEWRTFNDVCTNITDGAHASPKTVDEGFPYVTVRDVNHKGQIDTINCKRISEDDFLSLKKGNCLPPVDSVLLSKDGTVGKVAHVTNDYDEFVVLSSLAIIVPEKTYLSPEYLKYFLLSPEFQDHAIGSKTGAAIKRIVLRTIKNFNIPVAPLEQQKRIVEKLDALLTRIDTAIEHLQESVTLKNSLLQSALDGQFSAITERMTIESLAEVKGGKRLPKGEKLSDEKTEHPYIRVADFTDKGTIDLSGIEYISKEIHEQIKRYVISKDDLYISIAGTIGKTGFVPSELDGANLTENAAKLVIKDKQQLDLSYLYLFTLTSDFSAQAGLATKTVAQPKLALTRLSKIEIPICSLEEQKSLVSTIEALKSKIHDAEAGRLGKIEDLKNLKASILDSAFKGEL